MRHTAAALDPGADPEEFSMHRRTGVTAPGGGIRRAAALALAVTLAALVAACATSPKQPELPTLPPVTATQTGEHVPGKFVWGDLVTHDLEASKRFYGTLFGWTFETDGRYTTVSNHGRPIAGIVRSVEDDRGTEWVGNLSVIDVDHSTALLDEAGMFVELAPVDAPKRGRISLMSSKKGALMMLVRSFGGDPPDADPEVGGWLWWELWTHDPDRSMNLLSEMTGLEPEMIELNEASYRVLRDPQARRIGIVHAPPEVNPTWLPFFRVADVDASAKQAVALGARLVHQDERSAILVDPNRAEFAIGVWAKETDRIRQEAK